MRLHSAIGFVAPADKLNGRDGAIFTERDRKLAAAREERRTRRQLVRDRQAVRGNPNTIGASSPRSSVASASPRKKLGDVEVTGRRGQPQAVPEPRPSRLDIYCVN